MCLNLILIEPHCNYSIDIFFKLLILWSLLSGSLICFVSAFDPLNLTVRIFISFVNAFDPLNHSLRIYYLFYYVVLLILWILLSESFISCECFWSSGSFSQDLLFVLLVLFILWTLLSGSIICFVSAFDPLNFSLRIYYLFC